jgi:hypothetical protein
MAMIGRLTRRIVMVVSLALHANPAVAETVLVPGVGVRTAVPSGNNPRAPRVYAPSKRTTVLRGLSSPRAKRRRQCCNGGWCRR